MKKILIKLLLTLCLTLPIASSFTITSAYANSITGYYTKDCPKTIADDEREQQKDLDGDGFIGLESTSGYVDEDGCPISEEDYAKIREDLEKGIFEKYPIPSAIAGLALVGAVAGAIVMLVKRKKS